MPEYEVDLYGSKGSPSNFTVTVVADNAHRAKELAVHQYGGRATNVHSVNWENPTIGADDNHEDVTYSSSSGSSSGGIGVILIAAIFFGFVTMCSSKDDAPRQQHEPQVQTVSQPQQVQSAPAQVQDPCAIWANANPTLATKLNPGDKCFGY